MVACLGAAPSVCRSGGYADGAPRFVGDAIASRVRRSERRGLLSSSRTSRSYRVEMAACAGIAPATFRSTGGCSS